ncbi:MAG: class I SAM-dependent methyltransferase [candidate division KSB1 bacterium]|jgi:2-polyprenyl-3-methyl-5-hydroxy-6-metoxy-1,4-benzoquinol methylase|nr:class I SAM-dependent methyltransferase [candidate division KSB1 bacterium]
MDTLKAKYESDMRTWDECADTYERQIVGGHPDILAFEEFEEDLLDRLLRHLALTQNRKIKLMDLGCGSGRLHLRYGAKTQNVLNLDTSHPLVDLKKNSHKLAYDPLIAKGLSEVWGIDFSQRMIDLAKDKLQIAGLNDDHAIALTFDQGSAFELEAQPDDILPIAICLVNSIGVMQGFDGANALFKSMRNAVEAAQGIAIVSCYQQEYIEAYALGQYESTMDVSGQPIWLAPDTYASHDFLQIPMQYKLAHSADDTLHVDVYDKNNRLIKRGHMLKRDPAMTRQTIETGDINTYSSYKSHWYSYNHIQEFIDTHWGAKKSYHVKTQNLDMIRAEPAQMAILDFGGHLSNIFKRWKVVK